ncbi:MAG: hypothetical protein HQL99_10025 [Magnetococcales bacterium]|nr:hypothetical protein [Magnetococcales bacterium]
MDIWMAGNTNARATVDRLDAKTVKGLIVEQTAANRQGTILPFNPILAKINIRARIHDTKAATKNRPNLHSREK